jgi:hypothetical protein
VDLDREADKSLRGFTKTKATISVDIVRVEFNLNGIPNNAVHMSGSCRPDNERIRFSETSVLTSVTQGNIPENGILHSQSRENLNSYIAITGCVL